MFERIVISLLALPAASALTVPSSATSADAGNLHVVWSSPPGCPTAEDALERVSGLLQQDIAAVLHRPLEARALVTELDSGKFRLELETRQEAESGTRSVEADTCQELTQVGALVIALTIDPELLGRTAAAAAPEAGPAEPQPAPPPPVARVEPPPAAEKKQGTTAAVSELEPSGRRAGHVHLGLGAALVADVGSLPGGGFGPELSFHAQWPRLRLEFGGIWLPARTGFVAGSPDVSGSIDLLALSARGCHTLVSGSLRGGLCGIFEIGRRSAEAFGAVVNSSGTALWVTPGLGLSGSYALSSLLTARGRLEALLPLERTEFIVENVGSVHAPSAVVGRFVLGIDF